MCGCGRRSGRLRWTQRRGRAHNLVEAYSPKTNTRRAGVAAGLGCYARDGQAKMFVVRDWVDAVVCGRIRQVAARDGRPVLSPEGATLYIGSADKNVYALNTADGSVTRPAVGRHGRHGVTRACSPRTVPRSTSGWTTTTCTALTRRAQR